MKDEVFIMLSKRVKQILGIGVIIVVIAGVVFLFTRLNKPVEEPEPVQTTPIFATEETVDDPSLLEEEEEFKWIDVDTKVKDDMLVSIETKLRKEPRDTAQELATLAVDEWVKRDAYCTDMNGVELQWDRVVYNGKAGYVRSVDVDIMVAGDEMEEDKVPEETSGVSEDHSIVDIAESEEPTAQPTEKPEASAKPEESAQPTAKPEASAKPEATPAPTQAPKQEQSSGGLTPEGQALLDQIIADGGMMVEDLPVTEGEAHQGTSWGNTWE